MRARLLSIEFLAIFALFLPTEASCSRAEDQWEFIVNRFLCSNIIPHLT